MKVKFTQKTKSNNTVCSRLLSSEWKSDRKIIDSVISIICLQKKEINTVTSDQKDMENGQWPNRCRIDSSSVLQNEHNEEIFSKNLLKNTLHGWYLWTILKWSSLILLGIRNLWVKVHKLFKSEPVYQILHLDCALEGHPGGEDRAFLIKTLLHVLSNT